VGGGGRRILNSGQPGLYSKTISQKKAGQKLGILEFKKSQQFESD
jgi:hypothetical protein